MGMGTGLENAFGGRTESDSNTESTIKVTAHLTLLYIFLATFPCPADK